MMRGTILGILAIIVLVLISGEGLAGNYLPLDPGITWTYQQGSFATTFPSEMVNDVATIPLYVSLPDFNGQTYYLADESDIVSIIDIRWHSALFQDGQWYLESDMINMSTPIQLFERPLTPGLSTIGLVESDLGSHFIQVSILDEQVLDTPYGELTVVPVILEDAILSELDAVFYFHQDIGLVGYNEFSLVEVSGLVPVQPSTWGGIKSLYR